MDVTRSEVVPAELRLLEDGSPVTGATIVLDIRRAGDGFVVDWADSTLKALGSVGTRYLSVPQVSATDHQGLYLVNVNLGTVVGIASSGDVLVVTYYEQTAGPTYTPLDEERWRVVLAPATATSVGVAIEDGLLPIMGAGFDSDTDSLRAIRARGDSAWATPATVVLTDGSLTGAKIGANFVSTVQSGLAVPGSAMTLTAGERTAIQAKILSDATPFAGASIATILAFGAPPAAADNAAAVWAKAFGVPSANTFGWLMWRLAQWGTEIADKAIVGQDLVLRSLDLATTYATVRLRDKDGGLIATAPGEPARFDP